MLQLSSQSKRLVDKLIDIRWNFAKNGKDKNDIFNSSFMWSSASCGCMHYTEDKEEEKYPYNSTYTLSQYQSQLVAPSTRKSVYLPKRESQSHCCQ